MKKIIIYHQHLPELGGIETAIKSLLQLIDRDIYDVEVCFVTNTTSNLILQYGELAKVTRLQPETDIEADILLIASNYHQPQQIKAKKIIQWIHSDYEKYNLPLVKNNVDHYVAVSEQSAKVAERLFKIKCEVIQNLLPLDYTNIQQEREVLKLITNSRISPEKGFGRMKILCEKLTEAGVDFIWNVYGSNPDRVYMNQIIQDFQDYPVYFHGYRKDIRYPLSQADYLVQLSDFEGCPFAVLEALTFNIHCIVTDFESAFELIGDQINGYILPRDMNFDIQDYNYFRLPPPFSHKPKNTIQDWYKLFN